MIPKVIHYCWFGGNPLSPLAQRCIASWRKFMPDYEIRRWDESNFDVNVLPYTADAYKAGKYAFVSDYARFKILYEQGGLYFDTDVEVVRSMDDVLARGPFMGLEVAGPKPAVNPGLGIAAEAGMPLYEEILRRYENLSFCGPDGNINPCTMIPLVTDILVREGLKGGGTIEHVAGVDVYPPQWFNPFDDATGRLRKTAETRSIHLYAKSWMPKERALIVFLKRAIRRIFGTEAVARLGKKIK